MSKKKRRSVRRTRKPLFHQPRRVLAAGAVVIGALCTAKDLWAAIVWLAEIIGRLR